MALADLAFANLNAAVTAVFGDPTYSYTTRDGTTFLLAGTLREPSILEAVSPMTHAYFFADQNAFVQPPAKGDGLVVGSKSYTVYEVKADAGGGVTLSLQLEYTKP